MCGLAVGAHLLGDRVAPWVRKSNQRLPSQPLNSSELALISSQLQGEKYWECHLLVWVQFAEQMRQNSND